MGFIVFDGVLKGILHPIFYIDYSEEIERYNLHFVRKDETHAWFVDNNWQLSVILATSVTGIANDFIEAAGLQDWNLRLQQYVLEDDLQPESLQFKAMPVEG